MPVGWDELSSLTSANAFTISNAPARVRDTPDPWDNMDAQSLSKKLIGAFA